MYCLTFGHPGALLVAGKTPSWFNYTRHLMEGSFADAEGFEVVSIALERNDKTWKRAAEKDGFIWPYQIVQEARVVLLSSLAQKYAVSEIPAKFLISPEGTIIGVNQNYDEIGSFLESKLSES